MNFHLPENSSEELQEIADLLQVGATVGVLPMRRTNKGELVPVTQKWVKEVEAQMLYYASIAFQMQHYADMIKPKGILDESY